MLLCRWAVYEYDRFNQMTKMTSGAEDWRYLYTADDERVWASRVKTVNEIVHNWNARRTLKAVGEVLEQHATKIRDGAVGLQKAAEAITNSLKNPNLDPETRAVLEKALTVANKYIEMAKKALEKISK